jgi:membrane protease YdiL (CAAX protease family)
MDPPLVSDLLPGRARRQAIALLVLFYAGVYGSAVLVPLTPPGLPAPILSPFLLGTIMLLAVWVFIRHDASWRESLALGPHRIGSVIICSALGFVATYAANIAVSLGYLVASGDIEAQAAGRARWLASLGEVPLAAILPLAAFVAFWEETVFRGFLLGRLRASMAETGQRGAPCRRDAFSVVVAALCFGAGHGYQGVLGIVQTTSAGLVLGTLAVWRQSLWPCIGAHLAIDAFGLVALKALRPMLAFLAVPG